LTVLDARVLDTPHDAVRLARPRHYLMCTPSHFEVTYAINPWMDVENPVDTARALLQWEVLRHT
jgi:hypothetical protein